ncbi:zf-TFIIB domain-containing protein [Diaphorobacter sp. JS3051]|uniref:zf-TFIIB domain-containing protein n=1 Tax=Diaphorobacter sp. JS3051 TaxID=2792224 RepID=UPI0018C9C8E3|nr:zf-TFIIB domain-containing protein [Diaphorobacter sp. JS3051]QPN29760.1 zf-TFIIB domain-containing protein [Diaphorobacter sp. JS3051]
MPFTPRCPSCRQPADIRRFSASDGRTLELDLCFACQGMWFDPQENTRLAPAAVLELFALLHERGGDAHRPVSERLQCPRCNKALVKGYDVAQGGRYITYRCAARHGRFSTFGSFMVEKGFVRHLSKVEIEALAERVGTIGCTSCGAAVDIRHDHACPYCRSALSLLDPQAVDKALARHGRATRQDVAPQEGRTPDALADALVALERNRTREERARQRERLEGRGDERFDLLTAGIELVWSLLRR